VPGYTGSKEDFLPVLGPMARAGYRAVAIDLRGQYESPGPNDPAAYSLDALAADVSSVLAGLGPVAHLVGHSFGGLVTQRAVVAGARPRSHVLVGSGPTGLTGRRADIVFLMRQVIEEGGVRALAEAAAEMDRANPRMAGVDPEVAEFLFNRWLAASPTGLRVMGEELTTAPDDVAALAAVGVPTLVVHGEADDAWSPDEQRAMADRLAADCIAIAGSVHSPACEEPEAFVVALLGFWSQLPAGEGPATANRAGHHL